MSAQRPKEVIVSARRLKENENNTLTTKDESNDMQQQME